jgi:O-acetyl-ADP-ribose deacetylase (regulator of RNase III)
MLKYTDASLFDSPAQTLVNSVNTVGVMGKGIALEFKRRYPEMFERYREHCGAGRLQIGKLYVYRTDHYWVLNFPTKQHWRSPSRPEWIEKGLQKFVSGYAEQGITSASFPQLGCGNGGLDWERVVRPMMERYLNVLSIPIFVHIAQTDVAFVPEHLSNPQLQAFRHELRKTREPIGFARFFEDVQLAAGQDPTPLPEDSLQDDIAPPLPAVQLSSSSIGLVDIPGEDFAELWDTLVHRGAVALSELPAGLRDHSESTLGLLLQLPYIVPMRIEGELGVRFAPPAVTGTLASIAQES